MTAVREPPVRQDLDAEREIDLGRLKRSVVERWWIVVAGVVAGVIVGALYSLSGGSVWEASALIAPGQPFSPSGAPVLTYQASPRSINVLVTSESALKRAAAAAHVPVGTLRGHVTTESIATGLGSTASRGANLIKITVQLHKPKHAEDVANALGNIVIADTTSPYVKKSILTYQSKEKRYNDQLTSLTRVIESYTTALAKEHLAFLPKLIMVNQLDAAIARQGALNDKLAATDQQLTLVQNVEIAQLISRAAAVKTTARSRRNSILVGALIGLIGGLIAAIVVDMRARRA
jgi:capsular polysaccharide biosynthesis protein